MKSHLIVLAAVMFGCTSLTFAQPGEQPILGNDRVTQNDITNGSMNFRAIRTAGARIFASPFNKLDGYGDGPVNPANTTDPGNRPTLQNNGTFLRINGLDAQNCQECHSVGSNATVPFTFALGGVGHSNNNAMFKPTDIDVDDSQGNGYAAFNGRYINPPFLFGSGGVEKLGKEMTVQLQNLKNQAQNNPGTSVHLLTKGVSFGHLVYQNGAFDYSNVEGIDHDLVVRPFGRKGEFATVRGFDVDAMMFHMGLQPEEAVGTNVDDDGDGVVNEILIGEISALHIFNTTMERPEQRGVNGQAIQGEALFVTIGCADCHRPHLDTNNRFLTYSFPEVDTDPSANVFFQVNLRQGRHRFQSIPGGGVRVPLFSDLKRHDMGPGLAESFFGDSRDAEFITPRLWGIADTGPYLHDGRALTLTDAILLHGGEGQTARDAFANLSNGNRRKVLRYLRTLRTPKNPNRDVIKRLQNGN